jgi:hypothetical protein
MPSTKSDQAAPPAEATPTAPAAEQSDQAAPPAEATPTAPAAEPTPKPVYNWDELLPSTDAPAHVVSVSAPVDVLTEIPSPIRHRIEGSLMASIEAKFAHVNAGKNPKDFRPVWKLQRVTDEAQGKEFIRLINRYAKFRPDHWEGRDSRTPSGQITVRTGVPALVKKAENGSILPEDAQYWAVRYQAKPLESKDTKRLPGSASPTPVPAPVPAPPAAGPGVWQGK